MKEKKITLKDIAGSLIQLPKTMSILNRVDGKMLKGILVLSMLAGVVPVVTLLISQELLNSLVIVDRDFYRSIIILVVYIAASVLADILMNATAYLQSLYQYKLQYRLQYMIMDRCTRLKLRDFEEAETYNRIEKISGEISYRPFQTFLAVTSMLSAVVTMTSSVFIIFAWSPLMALLLLTVPMASLFYYLKIGQQEFHMVWNRANEERKLWYLNHLLTHDFSYKEMKVLGIGSYLLDKYRGISQRFVRENQNILNRKTFFDVLYGFVIQLIGGVVIGCGIVSAYLGHLLVGNVISIIRALSMVQSNSKGIMSNLYSIYSNSLYMDMLFSFLEETKQFAKEEKGQLAGEITDIELRKVSFSYDGEKPVVKKVSLHFTPGKKVAIVGPNGSGKSTLLKIIAGLYQPDSGEVLINHRDLKTLDVGTYYKKLSVLFQDFVKYEFTLRENIGFGDCERMGQDERLQSVIKAVKMDFLKNAKGEIDPDMQLGNWFENGRELSQGQWQKIALARAYFKEASCYILDEPNAALDTVSEREVFEKFFELSRKYIGIYISHRLSAAKLADEIVVMNQGEIVDIGTHEELLSRCAVYQELFEAENYEEL